MSKQIRVSLTLLGAMAATALAVGGTSHSRGLNQMVHNYDLDQFRRDRVHMMNAGMFIEFEDRLLLDELPHADYSRGGVYFFGTSAMKWSLATWTLPEALRARVGNYGIGGSSHELQFAFIRHMIEKRGLLAAGPGKVHVVLGLYYSMGQNWIAASYFKPLWERYGLYTYNEQDGIQPSQLPEWSKRLRTERARAAGVLASNATRLARLGAVSLGIPLSPTEKMYDPARVRRWAAMLADDGGMGPQRQMDALAKTIEYLKARGVGVTAVFVPERAPFFDLPAPQAYHKAAREVCESHGVEVVDLSRLLSEDEFWDINHSNYRGLMKSNDRLMALALERLQSMGVIDTNGGEKTR